MRHIPLTQGKKTIVDNEDYAELIKRNWHITQQGYAARSYPRHKKLYMHRVIMQTPDELETDHINRNKLDNRKVNLRICTTSQNQLNSGKYCGKSRHKGVALHGSGKWQAYFRGKYLGIFSNELAAAKAYKRAARSYGL